jgi:hypothetical protein
MGPGRAFVRFPLLAILLAVVAFLPCQMSLCADPAGKTPDRSAEDAPAVAHDGSERADREVVLYYFHGNRRCRTCRSIESQAKDAIESRYGAELESGALQWKILNVDEPANQHFVQDFDLVSGGLVVVEMNGDDVARYEVLQEAWTLVRDEIKFMQYVQRSVREYLE